MQTEFLGYHFTQFTFAQIIGDKASKHPDRIFLTNLPDGRTFTYVEAHRQSNAIANALLAEGIGKGTHVAMLMENSPEQVLAYFALGKIGAVCVPINTAARGGFLDYFLNQSDSSTLIADAALLDRVLEVAPNTGIRTIYVTEGRTGATMPGAMTEKSFLDLLAGSEDNPGIDVKFNDLCTLLYTSGTTGPSKGNMFSQIYTLTFAGQQMKQLGVNEDDCFYAWAPLYHGAAYCGSLLAMLLFGGSVALTRRFSVSNFWREVRSSRSTATFLLSVADFLFKQPPSPHDRDHKLRFAVTTPVPENFKELQERFGFTMMMGFGLTDFGMGSSQMLDEPDDKRLSIGRPLENVQMRVVDDEDADVPVGEVGEIVLRSDGMPYAASQGYYKMPEKTIEATTNLWFHTGDLGRMDADGYFYCVGRKKDAIRRRGENISAFEVERVIFKHECVAEVAVYPANANTGDDEVAVAVVLASGKTLTERELIDHCAAHMPYFMVPRFVEFRPELPRTTTQKVRKVELRAELEARLDEVWDREREAIKLAR